MWSKLDDALLDHRKIFAAGELLGKNGAGLALGCFTAGLLWSNKHGTDGHIPTAVVKRWPHFAQPLKIASALVSVNLWEEKNGGYIIHDYLDFNFTAEAVKERRAQIREARRKAGRVGGGAGRRRDD